MSYAEAAGVSVPTALSGATSPTASESRMAFQTLKPTRVVNQHETELDYSGFETGGGSTNGSVVRDG
jgi:hypothetical protein